MRGEFFGFTYDAELWYDAERVFSAEGKGWGHGPEVPFVITAGRLILPRSPEMGVARKAGEFFCIRGQCLLGDQQCFNARLRAVVFFRGVDLKRREAGFWASDRVEDCEGPWVFRVEE
jgi:hypothetical protein